MRDIIASRLNHYTAYISVSYTTVHAYLISEQYHIRPHGSLAWTSMTRCLSRWATTSAWYLLIYVFIYYLFIYLFISTVIFIHHLKISGISWFFTHTSNNCQTVWCLLSVYHHLCLFDGWQTCHRQFSSHSWYTVFFLSSLQVCIYQNFNNAGGIVGTILNHISDQVSDVEC